MFAAEPTGLQALDATLLIATVLVSAAVSTFVALAVEWLAKPRLEVRKAATIEAHEDLRQLRRRWSKLQGMANMYVELGGQHLAEGGPFMDARSIADLVMDAFQDAYSLVPVREVPVDVPTRQLAMKVGSCMTIWSYGATHDWSHKVLRLTMTDVLLPLIDATHQGLYVRWWQVLRRRAHRRAASRLLDESFMDSVGEGWGVSPTE